MIHMRCATGTLSSGLWLIAYSSLLIFKHLFYLVPLPVPFLLHIGQSGIGLLRGSKGPVVVLLVPEYAPALLVASSHKGVILSDEERGREWMGANAPVLMPPARLQLSDHCYIHKFLPFKTGAHPIHLAATISFHAPGVPSSLLAAMLPSLSFPPPVR